MWWLILCSFMFRGCSPQIITQEITDNFYQIAGIFEKDTVTQRLAFNESMLDANIENLRMNTFILEPYRSDSYSIWKSLCDNADMRPIAVFGPQHPITDKAVRDQCAIANIPHIQAAWQPLEPDFDPIEDPEDQEKQEDLYEMFGAENVIVPEEDKRNEIDEPVFKKISINFYPNADEISLAYAKLLKYYNWENFGVLYEDEFGLQRVQKILAEHTTIYPVAIRKLDPDGDNYKVFKELRAYQESRILLDCHVDRVNKYMEIAKSLNMVNHYQHYILVTMDVTTVAYNLTSLQSNVTWLSLTEHDKLNDILATRVAKWTTQPTSKVPPPVTEFELEALIMDDIAKHVLHALSMVIDGDTDDFQPTDSICDANAQPWKHGAKLQDTILKTQTNGVTGNIQFDETGKRINYTLFVNEIHFKKIQTIRRWESANGDEIIEDKTGTAAAATVNEPSSKHFIVISRTAEPYFYKKNKCDKNDEECVEEDADENYEGFSVDLIAAIFKILREENFNYTYEFKYNKDYEYGKYNPQTKKWDGLIGDLLDKKADLAVCDLTITEVRKKVVDFSVPFMSLGISILYTAGHKVTPGMFSFMLPYTFEVWMYTATAYFVVSIILYICARISPADWENPEPCDNDPEELENIWNFKNCVWLTMGSIMTQGCDILPKALGTRWICGMWWFFAVIVCQTYIAQLSASMTSALENEPINSIEDLAKQSKIRYGALRGGSTIEFFKNSKDKMYRKMYENMINNPAVLVKSNDEGENRVLKGKNKYAFFMESSTIDYKLKRNCNLKNVGNRLDAKDYGIAMPANSPFRSQINKAILRLKEMTTLDDIRSKWWDKKNKAKSCDNLIDLNNIEGDLEIDNLIGAFLVLIVGLVFCLFITAAEFVNQVRNIVVNEQVPFKEVFIKELKASLNFFQMEKPVIRNPSRAPSIVSIQEDEQEKKKNRRIAGIENFIDMEKEMK